MKQYFLTCFSFILLFSSCRETNVKEPDFKPKAIVEAVSFKNGILTEELSLQAQSVYLVKNIVTAPINCFIRKVFINPGDKVAEGQVLFEITTRERNATGQISSLSDTTLKDYGIILIKAGNKGIISEINSQSGDFVPEGSQMCRISSINSLVFKLQVPFEYNDFVRIGGKCKIEMADGKIFNGIINNELDRMSLNGQTRQYVVKPAINEFIPENLLATVIIITRKTESDQILPTECVLSDEMLQNFWIMQMINDSVAVRVNVKTGLKNKDEIDIIEPDFPISARILSSGNYGLADTALVNIEK
jgi:hypothetical protein